MKTARKLFLVVFLNSNLFVIPDRLPDNYRGVKSGIHEMIVDEKQHSKILSKY